LNPLEHKIIIAIDGYSGTGKSSTAKAVAQRLNYRYVDSGAMYRTATLYCLENQVDITNESEVGRAIGSVKINFELDDDSGLSVVTLDGTPVEDQIRTTRINDHVSQVAAYPAVRRKLVQIQQQLGKTKGIVMDGRDIGTVVFPNAALKVFMQADLEERARRRQKEMQEKGFPTELSEIKSNLEERDRIDTTRKQSPLIKAEDAIEIDTTDLTFEDQVNKIVHLAKETLHAG
jgi:cytidylate kinase